MLDSASLRPTLKSSLLSKSNVGVTAVLKVFSASTGYNDHYTGKFCSKTVKV